MFTGCCSALHSKPVRLIFCRWPEALHHSYFPWCSPLHVPSAALRHVKYPVKLMKLSMVSQHCPIELRQTHYRSLKVTHVRSSQQIRSLDFSVSDQKLRTTVAFVDVLFHMCQLLHLCMLSVVSCCWECRWCHDFVPLRNAERVLNL